MNPVKRVLNVADFHTQFVRRHSELKNPSGIRPDSHRLRDNRVDGHPVEELPAAGRAFTEMSRQIIPKYPCTRNGLQVVVGPCEEGFETIQPQSPL